MFTFFSRLSAAFLCFGISVLHAHAQTLLPGDVVVIGYNYKDPDEFSLLPLVDLPAGTQVCVTDCGWNSSTASLRSGEGLITYTAPIAIPAGSQLHYPADTGFVTQRAGGVFSLSQSGDQVIVFQGAFASPSFLFALSDQDGHWASSEAAITTQNSHLPAGLVEGYTALALNKYIQARFDCSSSIFNKQSFLENLSTPTHWTKASDRVVLPIEGCGAVVTTTETEQEERAEIECRMTAQPGTVLVFPKGIEDASNYRLFDASGKLLIDKEHVLPEPFEIQDLRPGIYVLTIQLPQSVFRESIIILE